jgi:hypothetical protein
MSLLPRGVHREPVLSCDGHPIIISVNHLSQEIQRRVILPGENVYSVVALLWEHLDAVDPEYSRRDLVTRAAQVAALLCTTYALERLAFLVHLIPPLAS